MKMQGAIQREMIFMFKRIIMAIMILMAIWCGRVWPQTGTAKSNSVLSAEVNQLFPDQNAGAITPFDLRQSLLDIIASGGSGMVNGSTCITSELSTYQFFANTTSAPTGTTLNIFDGTQCVPWATLNQTAHTLTLTGSTGSALAQALTINQTPSGTVANIFNANTITVTSSAAVTGASGFLQGLNMSCSAQTTSVQGGINCLEVITGLNSPSNASNVNHNWVGVVAGSAANSADGGTNTGAGAQGAIFGINIIGNAVSGATNLLGVSGGEVDCQIQTGASAKLKMCWSIVSTSLDAIHGAGVDAGLTIGAQSGAGGFNNAIRVTTANGIFPVPSTGTLFATDTGTVTFGIDLNNLTCLTYCFRSPNFNLDNTGSVNLVNLTGTNVRANGEFLLTNLWVSDTAPAISSGFCTSPSIPANNGTGAFTINVGTACAGSTGTLTMPAAATAWVCQFHDVTTPASFVVEQTGGTTTTVTLTNYNRAGGSVGVAANFGSSDVIRGACIAY